MSNKPTAAQRVILARMVAGQKIDPSWRRPKFLYGEFINRTTWRVLKREGWVKSSGITPAGRAALAEVERIAEAAGKERVG